MRFFQNVPEDYALHRFESLYLEKPVSFTGKSLLASGPQRACEVVLTEAMPINLSHQEDASHQSHHPLVLLSSSSFGLHPLVLLSPTSSFDSFRLLVHVGDDLGGNFIPHGLHAGCLCTLFESAPIRSTEPDKQERCPASPDNRVPDGLIVDYGYFTGHGNQGRRRKASMQKGFLRIWWDSLAEGKGTRGVEPHEYLRAPKTMSDSA